MLRKPARSRDIGDLRNAPAGNNSEGQKELSGWRFDDDSRKVGRREIEGTLVLGRQKVHNIRRP